MVENSIYGIIQKGILYIFFRLLFYIDIANIIFKNFIFTISTAGDQLGCNIHKVVLEEDGTEIDNDYLNLYNFTKYNMLLKDTFNQLWPCHFLKKVN